MSSEINKALKLLDVDEVTFTGTKSQDQVSKCEELLSITFSKTYRNFLLEYGNLDYGHIEIYGVTKAINPETAGIPDVVGYNLKKWNQESFPKNLLIIQNDSDMYACIDLDRTDSSGENLITIWDVLTRSVNRTLEMNFEEYLIDSIKEYVKNYC